MWYNTPDMICKKGKAARSAGSIMKRIRILPAPVILAVCALFSLFACARSGADPDSGPIDPETDYIVRLRGESGEPFRLMRGDTLTALLGSDAVLWYEEDRSLELLDDGGEEEGGSVYYADVQWNLGMIGAAEAFDSGFAGQGIRVGVLDSGVNPHPDLTSRLLPGHNYIEGEADPDDTSDTYGHGTKVAGLIAGAGEYGCIGTAPLCQIVPLKCTDGETVKVSALCRAIYGGIDDFGCRVLNLSLGIGTDSQALRDAADYAVVKGVVLVAGIGNGGNAKLCYPAAYQSVIGVGAVNREGVWYERSNHNAAAFIAAPGEEVLTLDAQGGYAPASGCSFAVPEVTGAAAVLLSADGTLTPGKIMDLLRETASDAGSTGYDEYYGWGILNLAESVRRVAGEAVRADPACVFLPEGAGPASAVRNRTDGVLLCVYMLAEYGDDGACLGVRSVRLEIPPRGTVEVPVPEAARWGQYLSDWEGVPLAPSRNGR